ncbi:MAG: DUF4212 domain-containing protein [Chloroflexi bacterium]|nr:DUF4212 domain-containing protein [Chloroflexota bacterium]
MIEWRERKAYWRHTKWQLLASLGPFVVAMILVPLYADTLNAKRFLGVPLGYFLLCNGTILMAMFVIVSWINRQDAIDHWHGADEDH